MNGCKQYFFKFSLKGEYQPFFPLCFRHWRQICEELERSFDPSSDDFTLEKIISLNLDHYAGTICEISGAASKELSIEQVQIWFCNLFTLLYSAVEMIWTAAETDSPLFWLQLWQLVQLRLNHLNPASSHPSSFVALTLRGYIKAALQPSLCTLKCGAISMHSCHAISTSFVKSASNCSFRSWDSIQGPQSEEEPKRSSCLMLLNPPKNWIKQL